MPITRRQALSGLVLSAAAAASSRAEAAAPEHAATLLPATNVCVLTPQAEEGPFYFDPRLERTEITEGRPGVPLRLLLQVLDAATCAPLTATRVDIWQADANGIYSGFAQPGVRPSGDGHFLRGTQFTDGAGEVRFGTIYPGWYHGRTAHIHFKIFLDGNFVLTGQIFLPDALSEFIYRTAAPYSARTEQRDTSNATDGVLRASGSGHASFCNIKEEADHYLASLVIGVDRSSKPVANGFGGPPPGKGPGGRPPGPPPFGGPHGGPPNGRPPGPPPGAHPGDFPAGPPPFGPPHPRPANWDQTLIPGGPKPSD
jgi:protocatechuate 3,4-dioxygenase beta subunit